MNRRRRIYEGKAKILYEGPESGTLVQHFKDDATAFNNKKRDKIEGKGVLNNRISEYLFVKLGEIGVPTHFIKRLNMREQLIREVEIIPLEVVARNVAAGSLATRIGVDEGTPLPRSIVEFYYKSDKLGDPMVTEEHITAFGWANPQELDDIMSLALRSQACFSASASGSSISNVSSAGCGRTTRCASCSLTRSRLIAAGCGTSRRRTSSTRTASAATWAAWSRPIRRSREGSGCMSTIRCG
jgi:phosphoribosylaminoimidazole-succinocarboxamide synthase